MTETSVGLAAFAVTVLWFRAIQRVCFYRAYFREKQWNLGKDPDAVLREEFGIWWRWFR